MFYLHLPFSSLASFLLLLLASRLLPINMAYQYQLATYSHHFHSTFFVIHILFFSVSIWDRVVWEVTFIVSPAQCVGEKVRQYMITMESRETSIKYLLEERIPGGGGVWTILGIVLSDSA